MWHVKRRRRFFISKQEHRARSCLMFISCKRRKNNCRNDIVRKYQFERKNSDIFSYNWINCCLTARIRVFVCLRGWKGRCTWFFSMTLYVNLRKKKKPHFFLHTIKPIRWSWGDFLHHLNEPNVRHQFTDQIKCTRKTLVSMNAKRYTKFNSLLFTCLSLNLKI